MKAMILFAAMLVSLILPALAVGQEGTTGTLPQAPSVELQLKQIEDDWVKANKNKDSATLKRILADDYFGTDEKGMLLNKEQYISLITSNPDVIGFIENFDMHARIYDNVAVVTGGIRQKGMRNGKIYADTSRWTDVFVKRGGSWQAVVSQWVTIP